MDTGAAELSGMYIVVHTEEDKVSYSSVNAVTLARPYMVVSYNKGTPI